MIINRLEKSYLNVSGKIYDSEFINLANIKQNKIAMDEKTLFLTKNEKAILNTQQIENFNDVVYVFKYDKVYGIVCDVPINEYKNGNIKCHELVIPEIVQGMVSNLHGYNCETAPVLLAHEKKIDYLSFINSKQYVEHLEFKGIDIYVFIGKDAENITKEFLEVKSLYVADGHHRLYTTSLSNYKNSVLSCLICFDYLNILPIHRVIPQVDAQLFDKAKEFILNRFEISSKNTNLSKGKIQLQYNDNCLVVNLIELNSDSFWNNDIYRLNTQIISQAFRIFDTSHIKYLSDNELKDYKLDNGDVVIRTHPLGIEEFIECANNNVVMPPKSTWFSPKFPSFLVFKEYK
jgi:uncharacterized protein (DUF1015 family)